MELTGLKIMLFAILTTIVIYCGSRILGLKLGVRATAACGATAGLLSSGFPRVITGWSDIAGILCVFGVFTVIFAYFAAYYDRQ